MEIVIWWLIYDKNEGIIRTYFKCISMSFSNGGDYVLFVSDLLNFHGDALQRSFKVIFNTRLRNVNLQHFNRNRVIGTDYVQFNVEHTDFVDYVYSSKSIKYDDFDVGQLVGGLVNWLSNLAQSERKINIMNQWIVQLSISRTNEDSVPRGSGKGEDLSSNVIMEKCTIVEEERRLEQEDTPLLFKPDEIIGLQVEENQHEDDDDDMEESDDEFDDDEGTLFNSDAFKLLIEKNVYEGLSDYSLRSGPLRDECLMIAIYVCYLRLTQPNNFKRIMSKEGGWLTSTVERKLVKIKLKLSKNENGGGHWNEVEQIQKLLVEEFGLTPFPTAAPSQDFLCLYRQNCNKDLSTYPVYVLTHEIKGKKSYVKKLYGTNDDGLFPNLKPFMLLLRDGHYYNVWDYQALYIDKDVRYIRPRKNVKGSLPCYKKRFCLRCLVSFCNEELHVCEDKCGKCLRHYADHDGQFVDDNEGDVTWCFDCSHEFCNDFCHVAHLHVRLNGKFKNYCELLRVLDQCDRCVSEFELIRRCRHKRSRKRRP